MVDLKTISPAEAKVWLYVALGHDPSVKAHVARTLRLSRPTVIKAMSKLSGLPVVARPRLSRLLPYMPPTAAKLALWLHLGGRIDDLKGVAAEAGMCHKSVRAALRWLVEQGLVEEEGASGFFLTGGVNPIPVASKVDTPVKPIPLPNLAPAAGSRSGGAGAGRGGARNGGEGIAASPGFYREGVNPIPVAVNLIQGGVNPNPIEVRIAVPDAVLGYGNRFDSTGVGVYPVYNGISVGFLLSPAHWDWDYISNTSNTNTSNTDSPRSVLGRDRDSGVKDRGVWGERNEEEGKERVAPAAVDLPSAAAPAEAQGAVLMRGDKTAFTPSDCPDSTLSTPGTSEALPDRLQSLPGGGAGGELDMWWLSAESASVNPVEAIRQLQIWRYRELCGKEPDAGLQDRYGRDAFAILRWLKIKRRRYSWLLDFVSWSNENDFWSGREPSKDGRRYKSWPYLLQLLHTQAVEQFDRASSQAPGPAMSEAMERQRARLKEQARSYQPGQMFRTPEGQYARVDRIAGQWIILDVGSLDEIGNPIGKGHRERAVTADDLARMTPVDGVLDR